MTALQPLIAHALAPVEFTVVGHPAPKGSKRLITHGKGGRVLPKPLMLESSKHERPWRKAVADTALFVMQGRQPFVHMELDLRVTFALKRPTSHLGKNGVRPSAPHAPLSKPDLSKLVRSLEDALTGIVWDDDARIVRTIASKVYAPPGCPEGAWVRVQPLSAIDSGIASKHYADVVHRAAWEG